MITPNGGSGLPSTYTPSTGYLQPTQPQTTPAPSTKSPSGKLDYAELNKSTAAEIANWAYKTFKPGTTWDQTALTEFYDWLDEKGEKDSEFKANVLTYLEIMGWAES